nr:unnamed protein product [Callosobruchus chinensis]
MGSTGFQSYAISFARYGSGAKKGTSFQAFVPTKVIPKACNLISPHHMRKATDDLRPLSREIEYAEAILNL